MDISGNINDYLKDRLPDKRYSSFDYCYNYFREFYEQGNIGAIASSTNVQLSCLQLGFYLASWGMFRGKAFLLQKSAKHYEPLISVIAEMPKVCWEIDLDAYSDKTISLLLEIYKHISGSLGKDDEYASPTLVTKIMLGVFGNVPALDDNFCKGFGFSKYFSRPLLQKISDFYQTNEEEFDKHRIKTIDFSTGIETDRYYTKAKLIDMVGFIEGLRKSKKQI
jgi:hypothetical protein